MVRRAFVIASLLGAVSAAAALAVAPEIARFGRSLGIYAALKERGFTPDAEARAASAMGEQGGDSLAGKYCRFPSSGSQAPVAANVPPNAEASVPLILDGQSRSPVAAGEAVCAGDSTTPALPASGLIAR